MDAKVKDEEQTASQSETSQLNQEEDKSDSVTITPEKKSKPLSLQIKRSDELEAVIIKDMENLMSSPLLKEIQQSQDLGIADQKSNSQGMAKVSRDKFSEGGGMFSFSRSVDNSQVYFARGDRRRQKSLDADSNLVGKVIVGKVPLESPEAGHNPARDSLTDESVSSYVVEEDDLLIVEDIISSEEAGVVSGTCQQRP